ncbi:MAG: DUF3224 domain-containing protein [Myxococcales bacterium]|nr:DUF3224 domain-containing protein [Myxococcales bacterium]
MISRRCAGGGGDLAGHHGLREHGGLERGGAAAEEVGERDDAIGELRDRHVDERAEAAGHELDAEHDALALEATGHGEMLTAGTAVQGSAGYVAIERVTGTLHGRAGSFVLHHLGTMTRGVGEMTITVVPDSGAGALVGLTGKLTIHIVDGKHSYDFDYAVPQ